MKSNGADIHVKIVYAAHIVNCYLESGFFLKFWRVTIVCPFRNVFKPNTVQDLRPINLLSGSKILFICSFMIQQSGFPINQSTTTLLLNFIDGIIRATDNKLAVALVSLGYSTALTTLQCLFIKSYLRNKCQRVHINYHFFFS